jgi:hypothetical protein
MFVHSAQGSLVRMRALWRIPFGRVRFHSNRLYLEYTPVLTLFLQHPLTESYVAMDNFYTATGTLNLALGH